MLGQEIIKALKQTNISKDNEKVRSRVKQLWKATPSAKRAEILALAGVAKTAVSRSYTNGNISAKLVAAMAESLQVDPYYLIGAIDDQQNYSDELLTSFLMSMGYEKLLNPTSKQGKRGAAKNRPTEVKKEEAIEEEIVPEEQILIEEEIAMEEDTPEAESIEVEAGNAPVSGVAHTKSAVDSIPSFSMLAKLKLKELTGEERSELEKMPDEEMILLTKGLLLRSRYSSEAKNILSLLKLILVG